MDLGVDGVFQPRPFILLRSGGRAIFLSARVTVKAFGVTAQTMMQFSSIEQQIIENSGPAPSQLHFQTSILVFWQLHIPCVFSQCLSLSSDWTFLRRSAVTVSTLTIKYPSLQRRLITPHTGGKHFRVWQRLAQSQLSQ